MTADELLLLGERLRNRRISLGVTQESVSEQIGISLRYYQMIERGERKVSLETLIGLSKALNICTDYLLFGNAANTLGDPVSELLSGLNQKQRDDAFRILQLYAKACNRGH